MRPVRACALAVDVVDLLVVYVAFLDRVAVLHAEGQHVAVVDGVDDRVLVQLRPEHLRRRRVHRVSGLLGILREDGRAGEPEHVVLLEALGDELAHVAELGAVALVEDDDHVLAVDCRASGSWLAEDGQLLNGRDDDLGRVVAELLREHLGRPVGVGRALGEAVVLAHRLVVEVLAVHDEEHLVDALDAAGELRALEARERLARARGVPHVAARVERAEHLRVQLRHQDTVQDALRRRYLVEQQVLVAVSTQYLVRTFMRQRRSMNVRAKSSRSWMGLLRASAQ